MKKFFSWSFLGTFFWALIVVDCYHFGSGCDAALFSLTTINPLETAGLCKVLHIFAAIMEILQMLPLILENSPFACIIAIFLNKIILEIKTFSSFLKSFNSSGTGSNCRLPDKEFHFYKDVFDMFHIYPIFHQMTSLDDTIFHA